MMSWICPECGCECLPTDQECAGCTREAAPPNLGVEPRSSVETEPAPLEGDPGISEPASVTEQVGTAVLEAEPLIVASPEQLPEPPDETPIEQGNPGPDSTQLVLEAMLADPAQMDESLALAQEADPIAILAIEATGNFAMQAQENGSSLDDSRSSIATETLVLEGERSEIENLAAFAGNSDLSVIVGPPPPWANEHPVGYGHFEFSPLSFANACAIAFPRLVVAPRMSPMPVLPPPPPALVAAIDLPKPGFRAWLIPSVVALVIALAVASTLQKFLSGPDKFAGKGLMTVAAAPPSKPSTRPKPSPSDNEADSEYPFARFVEVTGLRVVEQNDRSQVQYLVVNHSSAQLTDIGLHIAVRAAASPDGSLPIFTLAARVPSLGPHESKEIRTDLDSSLRSSQIPDWENLRTKVRIISPQ